MAAPPLNWKEGEGYDIHLLRGGPASKPLIDALDIDDAVKQNDQVVFIPRLKGASNIHGVEVDSKTGVVRAIAPPDFTFPRIRNFILTAIFSEKPPAQPPPEMKTFEAEIRIHIHDGVKDLWLTPPTLTIHKGADECRFTVLARFTDDCVGDITDWKQLTYKSGNLSVATVSSAGILKAEATNGSASITVDLTSLGIDKTSPPAKALAKPSWADVARTTRVSFVAGKRRPNESNVSGPAVDSVKSVVENAKNILFIAEGFRHDQRFDFRNIVNTIVAVMRGDEAAFGPAFQPFNILKDSINYWVVFVPSENDGISVLGRHVFAVLDGEEVASLMLPHVRPDPAADEWNLLRLLYEVGLPLHSDATRSLSDLLADWQKIYGDHVTPERTTKAFDLNWWNLPFHTVLNERDSAFGLSVGVRQRLEWRISDVVELHLNSRRMSQTSLQTFLENLTFGGFPIGLRWKTGGPDFGLVGFLCLTDRTGGTELSRAGYFAASTGLNKMRVIRKKASDPGMEIITGPVISTYRHLMASKVVHEIGHALGDLGDEYGDGSGGVLADGSIGKPFEPNVQAKVMIAPPPVAPATITYDSSKIRWTWPRITKAGVLPRMLEASDVRATNIRVPLRPHQGRIFAVDDVVRFKLWPVSLDASLDFFAPLFFKVKAIENDAVTVIPVRTNPGTNAVTDIQMASFDTTSFLTLFDADKKYSLIKPRRKSGNEIKLVAPAILRHIEHSKGPLNADSAAPGADCVAAANLATVMTPRNIPTTLTRLPRTKADIIGIYEGGSVHDCGVFRPAGRCKMRDQDIVTIPFCFVCRYILVDTVDPSRHGELDKLYPEVGD